MPGIARVGDTESGSCPIGPSSIAGPLAIASGSGTVFVNGKAAARTGDPYAGVHVAIPVPHPPHGVSCGQGSGSVFFDGKPVFRIGDPTSCPSVQVSGSGDVIAG
ncbi:MAG: PAAR domain-containing protein [Treponema sp.]|jgi:uncharacterized Zn-binding protein involved in type VI secretion|nr:PAAR domain-containing protein [Treponema sp.]